MSIFQYATKDYYAVLGLQNQASLEDIKKSFFHLAKEYHPDMNHEPGAADKFKEINEAFQVVGNAEEKAIYDKIRASPKIESDHFARTPSAPAPAPKTAEQVYDATQFEHPASVGGTAYQKETQRIQHYRKKLIAAAIFRVAIFTLIMALLSYAYVLLIEILSWAVVGFRLSDWQENFRIFLSSDFLWNGNTTGSVLSGLMMGLILGIDFNFKIETFITNQSMKKTYHLLRTLLFTFAFAFLFSLLYTLIFYLSGQKDLFIWKIVLLVLGLLVGSTISSDGNFVVRIKSGAGRRELFFIFLRNLGFGVIGGVLGALLGFIAGISVTTDQFLYMCLTGFALLTALGSTSEEEINNMVREIDEGTRKVIFIVFLLVMLVIGIGLGWLAGQYIKF